jgi:hypothetical protein
LLYPDNHDKSKDKILTQWLHITANKYKIQFSTTKKKKTHLLPSYKRSQNAFSFVLIHKVFFGYGNFPVFPFDLTLLFVHSYKLYHIISYIYTALVDIQPKLSEKFCCSHFAFLPKPSILTHVCPTRARLCPAMKMCPQVFWSTDSQPLLKMGGMSPSDSDTLTGKHPPASIIYMRLDRSLVRNSSQYWLR